jgi:hypothetical protein
MSKAKTGKHSSGIIVIPSLLEVSKSPFIIEKVERARAFIAKHGLPKDDKPAKKTK